MKYNKWTVALAALGVVSLASAARAEEKASSVATALSGTTISGYVDTSAQWNFRKGEANLPPYKFGGASKADGFNLDVVQLRVEKPLTEEEWAAGYRADLWFGPDANTLGTQSFFGNGAKAAPGDFAIRQAYVALRAPIGKGLDFKVGVFDSILGYESIESGNNPNYTRSYGHSIEPQTHTGVLASYRFCECFSLSGGVADTLVAPINGRANPPMGTKDETYKTYMGSFALTAPDSWGWLSGSTLYAGAANGFADTTNQVNATSVYAGATMATPIKNLRAGVAFDYLDIHNTPARAYSVAGYLSFQATEKLSFHGRLEFYRDEGGVNRGILYSTPLGKAEVLALTATVQYDLWKNVISRVEFRYDQSLLSHSDLFNADSNGHPDKDNAFMLAANLIYKF